MTGPHFGVERMLFQEVVKVPKLWLVLKVAPFSGAMRMEYHYQKGVGLKEFVDHSDTIGLLVLAILK